MSIQLTDELGTLILDTSKLQRVTQSVTDAALLENEITLHVVSARKETVLVQQPLNSVILAGAQGPKGEAGTPGIAEDEMVFSKRIDFITENELYRGEAQPGTLDTALLWRIRRIIVSGDGDITETWAGGSASFNKRWDQRLSYTYS